MAIGVLVIFNQCISITWPLNSTFDSHKPLDMHRGMFDNITTASYYQTRFCEAH